MIDYAFKNAGLDENLRYLSNVCLPLSHPKRLAFMTPPSTWTGPQPPTTTPRAPEPLPMTKKELKQLKYHRKLQQRHNQQMTQQQLQYEQQQQPQQQQPQQPQQQQQRPAATPGPSPDNAVRPRAPAAVNPEPSFRSVDYRVNEPSQRIVVLRHRLEDPAPPSAPALAPPPAPAPAPNPAPVAGKKRKLKKPIQTKEPKSVGQISQDLKRMKREIDEAERHYRQKRKQMLDLHRRLDQVPTRSPLSRIHKSDPLKLNISITAKSDSPRVVAAAADVGSAPPPAPSAADSVPEPVSVPSDPPTPDSTGVRRRKAFRGSVTRRPANMGDRQPSPPTPPASSAPSPARNPRRMLRGRARGAAQQGISLEEYRRRRKESAEREEKEEEKNKDKEEKNKDKEEKKEKEKQD